MYVVLAHVLLLGGVCSSLNAYEAYTINRAMRPGINLGNALEAPQEGEWGVTLDESYFKLVASKGFRSVRVPIRWSAHALATDPYTIDPAFFERVEWVIEQAFLNGLMVIINFHHYEAMYASPDDELPRFLGLWKQVADRFQHHSNNRLLFEIFNEPHDAFTPEKWNQVIPQALAVIRESNPRRTVLVGTAEWGGIWHMDKLVLPADDNLILTIHYYEPFQFTHQGAEWSGPQAQEWLGTRFEGTEEEVQLIRSHMDQIVAFASRTGIPVNIGEFGSYKVADAESRAIWTDTVARIFESYGFSWHYWEFASSFGIYDPETGFFNQPLLEALIPGSLAPVP